MYFVPPALPPLIGLWFSQPLARGHKARQYFGLRQQAATSAGEKILAAGLTFSLSLSPSPSQGEKARVTSTLVSQCQPLALFLQIGHSSPCQPPSFLPLWSPRSPAASATTDSPHDRDLLRSLWPRHAETSSSPLTRHRAEAIPAHVRARRPFSPTSLPPSVYTLATSCVEFRQAAASNPASRSLPASCRLVAAASAASAQTTTKRRTRLVDSAQTTTQLLQVFLSPSCQTAPRTRTYANMSVSRLRCDQYHRRFRSRC